MSQNFTLITGGSRGIGLAIAKAFLNIGHDIILIAYQEDRLLKIKSKLNKQYPKRTIKTLAIDLRDTIILKESIQSILNPSIQINVLVNNAGVFYPGKMMEEAEGQLENMLQINVLSAYHLTRSIVPSMITHKEGHIFNISSLAGNRAYENGASYSISKYAMEGFSENLRFELKKDGIKVTTVVPGAVWTDSWDGVDIPKEQFIKADDVAAMIVNAYQMSNRSVVDRIEINPQKG